MWKCNQGYYVMDMSAFPDEKEVLLYDGLWFEVISLEQTVDAQGKPFNIIVLKEEWYD